MSWIRLLQWMLRLFSKSNTLPSKLPEKAKEYTSGNVGKKRYSKLKEFVGKK